MRTTLLFVVVMAALVQASEAPAQTRRQPGGTTSAQVAPTAVQTPVDPVKAEVASLRAEVNRLHAALESLRLTVTAGQAAYAKHRHAVASYGRVSAKTICPDTPAIENTQLLFTVAGQHPTGLSGPPE